jgi:hypothetical protein
MAGYPHFYIAVHVCLGIPLLPLIAGVWLGNPLLATLIVGVRLANPLLTFLMGVWLGSPLFPLTVGVWLGPPLVILLLGIVRCSIRYIYACGTLLHPCYRGRVFHVRIRCVYGRGTSLCVSVRGGC